MPLRRSGTRRTDSQEHHCSGLPIRVQRRQAPTQQTREIGIRMALGAYRSRVVRLLVAGGLKLVVIGSSGVPLVLGVAALLGAYHPSRRASRVNPSRRSRPTECRRPPVASETDSVLRGVIDSTMAGLRCRQRRCGATGRS